jgi:hypothetical protein
MAKAAELRSEAGALRKVLVHADTDAVRRRVLELINELERRRRN